MVGSRASRREETDVKIVRCPCGKDFEGDTDDELVAKVEAHVAEDHPDLVEEYSREKILEIAQER